MIAEAHFRRSGLNDFVDIAPDIHKNFQHSLFLLAA